MTEEERKRLAALKIEVRRRDRIFAMVNEERDYQDRKWGRTFDDLNTPNDWVAYLAKYIGQAVTMPWNRDVFRTQILKVMTICCAVLEREDYAPRHYDHPCHDGEDRHSQ